MNKPVLFMIVGIVVGLVAFALLAPLLFRGSNLRAVGALAFPVIVIGCGLAGFFFGQRRAKKQ